MSKHDFIKYWLLNNAMHRVDFDIEREIKRAKEAWDAIQRVK